MIAARAVVTEQGGSDPMRPSSDARWGCPAWWVCGPAPFGARGSLGDCRRAAGKILRGRAGDRGARRERTRALATTDRMGGAVLAPAGVGRRRRRRRPRSTALRTTTRPTQRKSARCCKAWRARAAASSLLMKACAPRFSPDSISSSPILFCLRCWRPFAPRRIGAANEIKTK